MNEQHTGKTYVGSDELYADVQRCMRLVAEMTTFVFHNREIWNGKDTEICYDSRISPGKERSAKPKSQKS